MPQYDTPSFSPAKHPLSTPCTSIAEPLRPCVCTASGAHVFAVQDSRIEINCTTRTCSEPQYNGSIPHRHLCSSTCQSGGSSACPRLLSTFRTQAESLPLVLRQKPRARRRHEKNGRWRADRLKNGKRIWKHVFHIIVSLLYYHSTIMLLLSNCIVIPLLYSYIAMLVHCCIIIALLC